MNYEVLKGVSADKTAQSLEAADDEVVQGPSVSPLLQQLCPLISQPTDLHFLRAQSVIHTVLWAFYIHCKS